MRGAPSWTLDSVADKHSELAKGFGGRPRGAPPNRAGGIVSAGTCFGRGGDHCTQQTPAPCQLRGDVERDVRVRRCTPWTALNGFLRAAFTNSGNRLRVPSSIAMRLVQLGGQPTNGAKCLQRTILHRRLYSDHLEAQARAWGCKRAREGQSLGLC